MTTIAQISALALATLLQGTAAPSAAQEATGSRTYDPSQYPCDVFSLPFCFTKPYKAAVQQFDGPDFEIHRVTDAEDRTLFSIYTGTTPEREIEGTQHLLRRTTDNAEIILSSIPIDGAAPGFEARISLSNGLKLHVFGAMTAAGRQAMADALATFRLCRKRGASSVDCDEKPLLSVEDVQIIAEPEPGN